MALVVFVSRYGGWSPTMGDIPGAVPILLFAVLGLVIGVAQIRWRAEKAPRYLVSVEWDDQNVVLHPQRGEPIATSWASISHTKVSPYPKPWGRDAASATSVRLFLSGVKLPYNLSLSWDEKCRAFLSALETKAELAGGDDLQGEPP